MSLLDQLAPSISFATVANSVISFAQAAGLSISQWAIGSIGQQMSAAFAQVTYTFAQLIPSAIRGFGSLATSTDPGDVDVYNPSNASLPWSPGYLSALGQGTYGTTRIGPSFASCNCTLTNSSSSPITIFPDTLIATSSSTGNPTFRNAPSSSIYANSNGSVTILGNASLANVPFAAQVVGTAGSAAGNSLSLTTVVPGLSIALNTPAIGSNVQVKASYVAACQAAMSRLTFNGQSPSYGYFAQYDLSGNALVVGGATTTINRTYVSQSSTTGVVDAYYASPGGPCTVAERDAANANIALDALIVPDAITFGPFAGGYTTYATTTGSIAQPGSGNTVTIAVNTTALLTAGQVLNITDGSNHGMYEVANVLSTTTFGGTQVGAGTGSTISSSATVQFFSAAGGGLALATAITVTGTAKLKGATPAQVIGAQNAMAAGVALLFQTFPIGGVDQTAGAGVMYTSDIEGAAYLGAFTATPVYAIYDVVLSAPSGSSTSLALGHVATLTSATFTVTST